MASSDNKDDEYLKGIKFIERNLIFDAENFNHLLNLWSNDAEPTMPFLISKAKTQENELLHEVASQESLAKSLRENENELNKELDKSNTCLQDLNMQEDVLKEQLQDITSKIDKLKQAEIDITESKSKKKREIYKNFAKVSKQLSCTRFDYQGPNISGFISNKDNLDVFNLNPEVGEQNVSKYLWKSLQTVSTEDWSDIFADEMPET